MRASGGKTSYPASAVSESIPEDSTPGINERLSGLRKACLTRDRHRCVVTRRFDQAEADRRLQSDGYENARDDDGRLLKEEEEMDFVEVAHILPHGLMTASGNQEAKGNARKILSMFDSGVLELIRGFDIDHPGNALTLTHSLHKQFGEFKIYFEPAPNAQTQPTYNIKSTRRTFSRHVPVTRTLYEVSNRTIALPNPRFLAIHRAIALILHMSAAGEYIDRILREMEEPKVKSDGTTELGQIVALRLGDWWSGSIAAY